MSFKNQVIIKRPGSQNDALEMSVSESKGPCVSSHCLAPFFRVNLHPIIFGAAGQLAPTKQHSLKMLRNSVIYAAYPRKLLARYFHFPSISMLFSSPRSFIRLYQHSFIPTKRDVDTRTLTVCLHRGQNLRVLEQRH